MSQLTTGNLFTQAASRVAPATLLALRSIRKAEKPPVWVLLLIGALVVGSWIPIALAIRARANFYAKEPRIHLIQDMDNQIKYKAQDGSTLFADGRAMRAPVPGVIARGDLELDDHYYLGYEQKAGQPVHFFEEFPSQVTVDAALLDRGQKVFNYTCAVCHGRDGAGMGPIHQRALQVGGPATGWVQPTNLNDDTRRERPVGHLYNTINNGIRNMAGYGTQIQPHDRWAVVAYVRALQLSHGAPAAELSGSERPQ